MLGLKLFQFRFRFFQIFFSQYHSLLKEFTRLGLFRIA